MGRTNAVDAVESTKRATWKYVRPRTESATSAKNWDTSNRYVNQIRRNYGRNERKTRYSD